MNGHFLNSRIRARWGLAEMLKFKGDYFYGMSDIFGALRGFFEMMVGMSEMLQKVNDKEGREATSMNLNFDSDAMQETWNAFRRALIELDMELPADSLTRMEIALKDAGTNMPAVRDAMLELQGRMRDELSHMEIWLVTKEERRWLKSDPFGPNVAANFHPMRDDLEEAAKCLAFGRGTACVFHLMRVMEVGLRALGASLNDETLDPKRNPSWDAILKRCDHQLTLQIKDRSAEWRVDNDFYAEAVAQLHAVKDAWRNPTMHIERSYMPDQAEDVWNAVGAFMRHLSKKLSE